MAARPPRWNSFNALQAGTGTMVLVTVGVFLLEAVALATTDPWEARRLVSWGPVAAAAILAGAMQAWTIAYTVELNSPTGSFDHTALVTGFVLAAIALVLPVVLGLGWRVSLLFAAMFYPGVAGLTIITVILNGNETAPVVSALSAMPAVLLAAYAPPLLVACWATSRSLRTAGTGRGGARS